MENKEQRKTQAQPTESQKTSGQPLQSQPITQREDGTKIIVSDPGDEHEEIQDIIYSKRRSKG